MKFKLLTLITFITLYGGFAQSEILPPGSLDLTFGSNKNGIVRTVRDNEILLTHGAALQADGKIVVVGSSQIMGKDKNFALTRYNSDGTLDVTFGSQGFVITDMSGHTAVDNPEKDDEVTAVAFEGNQIIVTGYVIHKTRGKDIVLARYNLDGTLDKTFANGQEISILDTEKNDDIPTAIAIQSNQKIILVSRDLIDSTNEDIWCFHYNLNGMIQVSKRLNFNLNLNNNDEDIPHAVQIQPDGKIVIAGSASSFPVLIRLNADLSTDISFGSSNGNKNQFWNQAGTLLFNSSFISEGAYQSVELQSNDQKIVVGGFGKINLLNTFLIYRCGDADCVSSDITFGDSTKSNFLIDNFVKDNQGNPTSEDQIQSLKIQPDGKMVVIGSSSPFLIGNQSHQIAIARYNSDGVLDNTFGNQGHILSFFKEGESNLLGTATSLLLQPDSKIILIGSTINDNLVSSLSLLRYLGQAFDTTVPPSPNANTKNGGGCSFLPSANFHLFACMISVFPLVFLGWRRIRKKTI